VKVKAQGLLYAAKWIEEAHGRDALARVLRECSPEVRTRCVEAIAINWHPVEELIEFLQVSERLLGTGDGRIAEAMGAAGARANLRGVLMRVARHLTNPEFLMRRIANLWRQYNDEGELLLIAASERLVQFEIRDLQQTYPFLCPMITGWAGEVAEAIGVEVPIARHSSCRTRGAPSCTWTVQASGGKPLLSDG